MSVVVSRGAGAVASALGRAIQVLFRICEHRGRVPDRGDGLVLVILQIFKMAAVLK